MDREREEKKKGAGTPLKTMFLLLFEFFLLTQYWQIVRTNIISLFQVIASRYFNVSRHISYLRESSDVYNYPFKFNKQTLKSLLEKVFL